MAQTITQLTLAWLIATIEATRAGLAGSLAQTPVADWGAAPAREVRNHEQDLHTAMQVLGDMLNQRGAFAASGIPAAPHLERAPAYVCGVDLSAEGLADLKKALADPLRHGWRACIERMPAPALEAPAAPVPAIEGLLDEDGENQAVRMFLMAYGSGYKTLGTMAAHMRAAGWPQAPEWAKDAGPGVPLTKGGAQSWLRHLFALEGAALAAGPQTPAAPVALPWRTGIPRWTDDRSVRVIAVTAQDDFGGVQVHDIRASDFHTDSDGDGAEVARVCTHWAYRDDIWPCAGVAAPAAPEAVGWPVAREELADWAQFADRAKSYSDPRNIGENMATLAQVLARFSAMAPVAAPAAPAVGPSAELADYQGPDDTPHPVLVALSEHDSPCDDTAEAIARIAALRAEIEHLRPFLLRAQAHQEAETDRLAECLARPSATTLNVLRVALERGNMPYRATGFKDHEIATAAEWVRAAQAAAKGATNHG